MRGLGVTIATSTEVSANAGLDSVVWSRGGVGVEASFETISGVRIDLLVGISASVELDSGVGVILAGVPQATTDASKYKSKTPGEPSRFRLQGPDALYFPGPGSVHGAECSSEPTKGQ